jgi:hypothetical protein
MTKTAVFVEGQTELILLREYLLRKFNWAVDIECRKLHKEQFQAAEYDFRLEKSDFHFLIVNIGNDQKVLSALLAREKGLTENGYTKIIGLRDMYSKEYRDYSTEIDEGLNNEMIGLQSEKIQKEKSTVKLFYAIMEIEAWILGMSNVIERLDPKLNPDFINNSLGVKINEIDPEKAFFHPAKMLNDIYELAGLSYDKQKGDIEALANLLICEDYDELYHSEKCNAFKRFYEELLSIV